ncbi:hypothetical protein QFZ81_003878 [Paenibacillus sp. V4I9]|uniref:hypothetical protein n=1 Tax=Paenibacillus sp. V4I9 TaxID=3042308 RepID=UPI002783A7DF|nr:hypothetical protein [Paenibacillus sp. V4I9]MDQ0888790.1 hypothetical protein [Paenibacillus sp. V4I9]
MKRTSIVLVICFFFQIGMLPVLVEAKQPSVKVSNLAPNPLYIIIVKKQIQGGVLESVVVKDEAMNPIINEINMFHVLKVTRSCPPPDYIYDVIIKYKKSPFTRSFTASFCPGTHDNANGIMLDPGISQQVLESLFLNSH